MVNIVRSMEVVAEPTLKPRPYQEEILDVCLKKNTIIYLPTGAGKTFIAVSAMKLLAQGLDKYESILLFNLGIGGANLQIKKMLFLPQTHFPRWETFDICC